MYKTGPTTPISNPAGEAQEQEYVVIGDYGESDPVERDDQCINPQNRDEITAIKAAMEDLPPLSMVAVKYATMNAEAPRNATMVVYLPSPKGPASSDA